MQRGRALGRSAGRTELKRQPRTGPVGQGNRGPSAPFCENAGPKPHREYGRAGRSPFPTQSGTVPKIEIPHRAPNRASAAIRRRPHGRATGTSERANHRRCGNPPASPSSRDAAPGGADLRHTRATARRPDKRPAHRSDGLARRPSPHALTCPTRSRPTAAHGRQRWDRPSPTNTRRDPPQPIPESAIVPVQDRESKDG